MTEITELTKFLADNYAIYLKLHNYHFNVVGPRFLELHKMFEEQYEELTTAIDEIAERIRQFGELVPVSFKELDSLKSVNDANNKLSAEEMVKDLLGSHEIIVKEAKELINQFENDDVTVDLLTQRIAVHEKTIWILRSSL